jgi:hypothetical protein
MLLLVSAGLAATGLALPPGEDPADWAAAARLAGLEIGCSEPWERLGCGGVARCREHGIRHVERCRPHAISLVGGGGRRCLVARGTAVPPALSCGGLRRDRLIDERQHVGFLRSDRGTRIVWRAG